MDDPIKASFSKIKYNFLILKRTHNLKTVILSDFYRPHWCTNK